MRSRLLIVLLAALSAGIGSRTIVATEAPARSVEQTVTTDLRARVTAAFEAAYNLDHDLALKRVRELVATSPNVSTAHRSLAAVLWLEIIFQRGSVTIDHYMGGVTKLMLGAPKPNAVLDAEFKTELAKAIDLAEKRLAVNAKDIEARYDLGAAYGLQASYLASVEGSVGSAFLSARRAYDAQETVLEADPRRSGAGVVVGTYRYMVSGLALPTRMVAYLMGFGGGKEKGMALIDAASRDPDVHVEAKTALILIYTREGRHADAMRLLGELAAEFPRNRLFVLEQGSAAIRAGKTTEAISLLTQGLAMFDRDDRRKIPGERALWLYKRGLAKLWANQVPGAATDLNAALESGPADWVRGRIHLSQGRLADLGGKRAEAVASYQLAKSISDRVSDPVAAGEAAALIRRPFVLLPRR